MRTQEEAPRIAGISDVREAGRVALAWYCQEFREARGRVVPLPAQIGSESQEEDEHLLSTPELDVWRRQDGSEYLIASSDREYVVEGAGPMPARGER